MGWLGVPIKVRLIRRGISATHVKIAISLRGCPVRASGKGTAWDAPAGLLRLVFAAAPSLVVFPVQLAALAMLPASGAAAGAAAGVAPLADPGTVGPVLTTIVLVAVAIGVRHGLRHSRLKERAVTVRPTAP